MPNSEIDMTAFEELKQMSGADFIDELVNTFLEEAPKLITELEAALKSHEADAFRRAAHSLKSNAATFGAKRMADSARELEMIGKENRLGDVGGRLASLEQLYQVVANELKGLRHDKA
jgi:HPt (histidine-containing phosphotransfer) domain-containing protein